MTYQTFAQFLLFVVLPTILLASLIEAYFLARKGDYDWKALGVSICNLVGRTALNFLPLSLATPVFALAWEHRIATVTLDTWQAVLLLFLGQEFFYYWFHRAAHRMRWFWASHSVHHSPNQLNLSAAYRLGMFARMTGSTLFFVPLSWLGFDPKIVIAAFSINLLYQFWIHATWIPKLGWLEYILNTPSAHRVHHASNLEYLDANYGGVLIIFDRMFGTYVQERDDLPCRYGLVQPVTTYNPLKVEFVQWLPLMRDLLGARSLREALGYIVMPPGWKPHGEGDTTEDLRRRAKRLSPQPAPPVQASSAG